MKAPSPDKTRWPAGLSLNRLLVPTDLSENSRKGLVYAEAFARQFHCSVYVLLVVETAPFVAGVEPLPLVMDPSETVTSGQRDLDRWLQDIGWPDAVPTVRLVRAGKLVPEIVTATNEQEIDLIIVATHGRHGVKHLLLGSSAEEIVRSAPCPVLVVREHEREFLSSVPSPQVPHSA